MSKEIGSGSRRILRVEKELHELISSYMVMQLGAEIEGIAAITRVIVSRDLRTAKALVYNQAGEKVAQSNADVLQSFAPEIQHYVNSQIRMKYCPKIHFLVDTKFDSAMRVQEELRKLELERKAKKEQTDE